MARNRFTRGVKPETTVKSVSAQEEEDKKKEEQESESDSNEEDESESEDTDDDEKSVKPTKQEDDYFESSEDEAEDTKMHDSANDEEKSKWILERIEELQHDQVGNYSKPTEFLMISEKLSTLREKNYKQIDYLSLADDIEAFSEMDDVMEMFSKYRGIYEFIVCLHRTYEVPLCASTPKQKHCLLSELMESAIRKLHN
jgi:hypothetical protein